MVVDTNTAGPNIAPALLQDFTRDSENHHFLYNGYSYLTSHWPEISGFLYDPSYGTSSLASTTLLAGCVLGTGAAASSLSAATRGHYFSKPGKVIVGRKAERQLHFWLKPWAESRIGDRFYHMEIVGPTGQAKTSLMEYLAYQDLRDGMTVVIVETVGDFAGKMIRHADELGAPKFVLDPSLDHDSPEYIKWNPLSGDKERVAEQIADAVVNMDNSKESFFQEFGSVVLRRMFYIAEAYATSQGKQPTIRLVRDLLADPKTLDNVLDITHNQDGGRKRKEKKGPVSVRLESLDPDTKFWVEKQWLGGWDDRMRNNFTAGLQSVIDTLLAHREIADTFSPEPGEKQLDIASALKVSGALIVLRIDSSRYSKATMAAASLLLQRLQQAAESRPDYSDPPAMFYLDEIHNLMGFHNQSIAQNYANWLTLVRKKMVGVVHAYQSYGLIPEMLFRVLQTNARSKLISGGLGYEDANSARMTFGHAEKTERSTRRTKHIFSWIPPTVSEGTKVDEQPVLSIRQIQQLPRGYWYYQETRNGKQLPPVRVKAGKAPEYGLKTFLANRLLSKPARRKACEDYLPGPDERSTKTKTPNETGETKEKREKQEA